MKRFAIGPPLILAAALALVGCATAYQRIGRTGGYDDVPIDPGIYRVSFTGNGYASRERVERFLLRRCAELTLQTGHAYFLFVDHQTEERSRTWEYQSPGHSQSTTSGTATVHEGYGQHRVEGETKTTGTYTPPRTVRHTATGYYAEAVIRVLKDKPQDVVAFEARTLLAELERRK